MIAPSIEFVHFENLKTFVKSQLGFLKMNFGPLSCRCTKVSCCKFRCNKAIFFSCCLELRLLCIAILYSSRAWSSSISNSTIRSHRFCKSCIKFFLMVSNCVISTMLL